MSLHSREASCSRQSPSTLERKKKKKKEGKGKAIRGHHCCPVLPKEAQMQQSLRPAAHLAHLRSRGPTLTRATRLSGFTLRGREKAIVSMPPGLDKCGRLSLLGIVEGQV